MARCESYDLGECTWGVCQLASWLPEGLGDAGDWAADGAAAGLQVIGYPVPGAVVVYGRGNGYSDRGHVALVTQVYGPNSFAVREMNFIKWDTYDERVSNAYDAIAFLLPPGAIPGLGGGAAESGGGAGLPSVEVAWTWAAGVLNDVVPALRDQLSGFLGVLRGL